MFLQGMIGLRVSHVLEVVPPDRLWYLENWKDRVDSLVPYHHRHMFIWSLEVSWNRGIPSHHPFLFGIFHERKQPVIGVSPWLWKSLFMVSWLGWWSCFNMSRCRPPMSISQKGLWFISGFIGFRSHGGSPSHHRFQYDIKWPSMTWMICGIPMTSDSPISCENH